MTYTAKIIQECNFRVEEKKLAYLILQTVNLYPPMHFAGWCATALRVQLKNFLFMH
jgi:hypothetical protein